MAKHASKCRACLSTARLCLNGEKFVIHLHADLTFRVRSSRLALPDCTSMARFPVKVQLCLPATLKMSPVIASSSSAQVLFWETGSLRPLTHIANTLTSFKPDEVPSLVFGILPLRFSHMCSSQGLSLALHLCQPRAPPTCGAYLRCSTLVEAVGNVCVLK